MPGWGPTLAGRLAPNSTWRQKTFSKDTREKVGKSLKAFYAVGANRATAGGHKNKGKKWTVEQRLRQSESRKKFWNTPEGKAKLLRARPLRKYPEQKNGTTISEKEMVHQLQNLKLF